MSDASARQKAIELLGGRPHFRAQLGGKLRARGFEVEEIDEALDRLERDGDLDDARAARDFVAHRRERKGWGKARVRAELMRRGCDGDLAQSIVSGLDDGEELELARRAAAGARDLDRARLARRLSRQGFAPSIVRRVLDEQAEQAEQAEQIDRDGETARPR